MSRRYVKFGLGGFIVLVALFYVWNPHGAPASSVIGRFFGVQAYTMWSPAMEPTIPQRAEVTVCFGGFSSAPLEMGDIVAFRVPEDRSVLQIKRVAALGGSTIEIRDSRVIVDGQTDAPWFRFARGPGDPWGPFTVPQGHVFILGDNLANSNDSRSFGPLPDTEVIGRVCPAA
jgi:signal peptidase I